MKIVFMIVAGLLLVTLGAGSIWFFYAEEDARGAQTWAKTLKQISDTGEPAHLEDLIPPEIPAEQNLAAIPLFKLDPDPSDHNALIELTLKEALLHILPSAEPLSPIGSWQKGQPADLAGLQSSMAKRYAEVNGMKTAPPTVLGKIDSLFPALEDLRQASSVRPQMRFERDYYTVPPYGRLVSPITQLVKLTQVIDIHALEALHENRSDLALEDIELTLKIDEALRHEPTLISGLVAAALVLIQGQSVWEGLHEHAWSDAQLARMQDDLGRIDFLADYQLCLRGEALNSYCPMLDYLRDHRTEMKLVYDLSATGDEKSFISRMNLFTGWLMPGGWFDLGKSDGLIFFYRSAREPVDPSGHRIYPGKVQKLTDELMEMKVHKFSDVLLSVSAGPLISASESMAYAQTCVEQADIGCALERYRLSHGSYPPTLDKIAVYFPKGIPHDPMTGDSYVYKLLPDHAYQLYSLGWNQVDDGGKIVLKPASPALDKDHGDWVWPCPDAAPLVPLK